MRTFTSFQAASFAVGQPTLETGDPNRGIVPTDRGLSSPGALAPTPEGGLLVSEIGNNRILLFATLPDAADPVATAVLGQRDFFESAASVSREGLNAPFGMAVEVGKMAVADSGSDRVLIYERTPSQGAAGPLPDVVIGPADFDTVAPDCAPTGMRRPMGVAITPEGKLIVADSGNNRVLIWDAIPAKNEPIPSPKLVLGQKDLVHCASNDNDGDGSTDLVPGTAIPQSTASTLSFPRDVWTDGQRLVIADQDNHRVLIWNRFPTRSFQEADIVLGHSDFLNTVANSEHDPTSPSTAPTARTLSTPTGIHSDGISLVVADARNNRVLVWNTFPDHSFARADVVLGHVDFDLSVTNDRDGDGVTDAPTANVFSFPHRVLLMPDVLLVTDLQHHRVLVFRR
ncbi:hypothetical protein [Ramlibacter henchirensis]|uniref:hypothetical protein n=1 Tax=Ramlibacter henchirensis TaxID=204072 RepID=UPI00143182D1|nr:hypothetical protein [Ramlibacter henchirensis]